MMNKLLEKLKQFFNKLKGVKTLLLTEVEILEDDENYKIEENVKEREFRENLNLQKEQELLNLQLKYEKNEIFEDDLSLLQVMDLIDLYKKQIQELDMEIALKEAKLNKA